MDKPVALLPCPFCGFAPHSEWCGDGLWRYLSIRCSNESCCNAFVESHIQGVAIEQWNRRAPVQQLGEAVREDARRYLWMIAEWNNPRGHFNNLVVEAFRTGEKLAIDAAIDAAIEAALSAKPSSETAGGGE